MLRPMAHPCQNVCKMKSAYIRLLALSLGFSALTSVAQFRFDQVRREMGTLLWKTPTTAVFTLTNTDTTAVVIESVRPDCGCTSVDYPRTAIAPGAKADIKVTYDAALLGHFEKIVDVCTNRGDSRLTVSGDVVLQMNERPDLYPYHIGDFCLDADQVEFDNVRRGDKPVKVIRIYNAGRQTITPELMLVPKYLSVATEPASIRPGRTGRIFLQLESEQLRSLGLTQTEVFLSRFKGDRVEADNAITISATLLPETANSTVATASFPQATLDSTALFMGDLALKKELKREVMLTNTGTASLEVLALQVYNPGLRVSLNKSTLKPGESAKIKIKARRFKGIRKGRRRVLLITNDPVRPMIVIDLSIANAG